MNKEKRSFFSLTSSFVCLFLIVVVLVIMPVLASEINPLPWKPWNIVGEQKLVVIGSEFSDVTHSVDSPTIKERVANMTKYFNEISLGKITINATFFLDHWEKLNNTMAYYGNGSYSQDTNGWQYITDSLFVWEKYVNFSDYDYLLVIHAGEDQSSNTNNSELLWRHSFCSFGHTAKLVIAGNAITYNFWGLAYDSEFEEWGLMAHEMGHGFGLPDLYVENETRPMDRLSLMANGDRNGIPEGTLPSLLEGFGMSMLGWITPQETSLNSTEDVVEISPLGYHSATLLRITLTKSTYYLIEVREKKGYDEDALNSTSLVVWLVDENKASGNRTALAPPNGILTEGATYSDPTAGVFVKFLSFNSITHTALVGLSRNLFFVDIDFPDTAQLFSSVAGKIIVFDSENNSVQDIPLNISIGEKQFQEITDSDGKVELDCGTFPLGSYNIEVSSPYLLDGELKKTINVVFPWNIAIIVSLILLLAAILTYVTNKSLRRRKNMAVFG